VKRDGYDYDVFMTEESLFLAALDLPDSPARLAFLAESCPDPVMRRQVEELLAAHDSDNPLDNQLVRSPLQLPTRTWVDPENNKNTQGSTNDVPQVIAGRYKILDLLGQGGMATVYRASQQEPVKRVVAVKVIKTGMDSKAVLARFDAERQALALMDHPNIAKVLDGGLHDGRPYFVMELVKGVPITTYCDQHKLTPKERLELFLPVCHAIQHAHHKGIIHRDIKPSNVLVARYDDKPVPKVIDFGIAKATGGALTEHSIDTGLGGIVGTPQYMSPEQATLNNLDIDTRSDVYALGILLYELLTGSPPFAKKELEEKGLLEILRLVREEEPARPSTKLSTADGLPTLSANRSTQPDTLTGLLRNELDWIVMKALEKDRSRRYDSANGFASDVQRYLNGETVLAHPPSTGYRLKKFVKRNKVQVLAACLVMVSLLVGMIGTTWGLIRAENARQTAETQRTIAERKQEEADEERGRAVAAKKQMEFEKANAEMAAKAEKLAKEQAEKNWTFSKKGNAILGSVFENLDPRKIADLGRPLQDVMRESLMKAANDLEGSAIGEPLEVAAMQNTLAKSLMALGEYKAATEVFQKSLKTRQEKLSLNHIDTLTSMNNLAESYREDGQFAPAMKVHLQTLNLRTEHLGPDHIDTLTSMNNLGLTYRAANQLDQAKAILEEALKLSEKVNGPTHNETLTTMNSLATVHQDAGELDLATRVYEKVLELRQQHLGAEHPDTLGSMNNLAFAYKQANQMAKAMPLYEETLQIQKLKLGPDHPDTLMSMNNLAAALRANNQLEKALPLYEETLRLRKSRLGADHPHTLSSMNNLALALRANGKPEAALPLMQETVMLRKLRLGLQHNDTLTSINNLALVHMDLRQMDKALPLLEQVLSLRKQQSVNHPDTIMSMHNYAVGLLNVGRIDEAIPVLEETLKLRREKLGEDHPNTLATMFSLALAYKSTKQLDKALPLLEEAWPRRKKVLGSEHPDTLHTLMNLGVLYCDLKQGTKGSALLNEYIASQRKRLPADSAMFVGLLAQLGQDLLRTQQYAAAEPMLRECLQAREKSQPDAWSTFSIQSALGGSLLGQKKYAEAEPMLVKGYEGMQAREKTIPMATKARLTEGLDRLIELYTATNNPEALKKYKDLRAKIADGLAK
jgi:eukaryotic-like serine/threonine-protein kinase